MGNAESTPSESRNFPGSALLDNINCGAIEDAEESSSSPKNRSSLGNLYSQAETLCAQSPSATSRTGRKEFEDNEYEEFGKNNDDDDHFNVNKTNQKILQDGSSNNSEEFNTPTAQVKSANPTSALFARALVSEVTDNPKTMTPAAMADREKKLLKAQERAKQANKDGPKPVGAPGGIGTPSVLGSLAHALTGSTEGLKNVTPDLSCQSQSKSVLPPNSLSENRAQVGSSGGSANSITADATPGKHTVTIGLSLSRRHSTVGHPDTVTRQTAFDFNELQDRQYKYVSSTDSSGWRAGGGERGGPQTAPSAEDDFMMDEFGASAPFNGPPSGKSLPSTPVGGGIQNHKIAAPDTVHIPIIHIDAESPQAVDYIISSLARGEVFIPHMAVLPEALSVNGVSPPDLVVRFGTERNDDVPPDEWPNWCLEFMHNQLYEYFQGMGARWMKRPFSITLAKKVRWKTVKHMNRYFAHAERVIDAWREKGPQHLDPQLAYIEGGATPEEVARPHGIYLLRNGVPTNYFAPNFDPPYTTKMTRSLLLNVLGKSWDKKRREWTSEPIPRLVTPTMLISTMCGCADNTTGGFMANEVTNVTTTSVDKSQIPEDGTMDRSSESSRRQRLQKSNQKPGAPKNLKGKEDQRDIFTAGSGTSSSPRSRQSQPQTHEPADSVGDKAALTGRIADDINTELENIHLASQGTNAKSPKYGRAPTPEGEATKPSRHPRDPDAQHAGTAVNPQSNEMPASVTGTNSTILAMNLSAEHFVKREMDRRQGREEKKEEDVRRVTSDESDNLACDDDWLDEQGPGMLRKRKQKKDKEAIDKERSRQITLIALAQEETSKAQETLVRSLQDPGKMEMAEAVMRLTESGSKSPAKRQSPSIQKNDSGTSLEYSVDSTFVGDSSTLGGSTLIGSHYATDTSVATTSSRGSRRHQQQQKWTPSQAAGSGIAEKEDAAAFSIQESSSSLDVPTDEELFTVGWAKALDPRSGSYYYFTLDRTKIVWDNPLAARHGSTDSMDSSSLPAGAAAI